MSCFTISRAIFVRVLFSIHGLLAVWRLHMVTEDGRYWYIITALLLMIGEAVITIRSKKGNEWKWFCPSVFLYLLCVVPSIWFLELFEMEKRIEHQENQLNNLTNAQDSNDSSMQELSANIASIGLEFSIPVKLTSDQWVRTIEQILLLFLILGRWLLPKGKLTHDQLSQLLLVYIGTAADIVEFFEAFKEEEVRYNRMLCKVILGIWSWSLIQFAMVLTATKARKDQSGLVSKKFPPVEDDVCCTPDVYGIIISICLQDAPFLVLRMLLIFKYKVVSYTNMFFTCKNTLVIMLLLYRLIVVQVERRNQRMRNSEYMTMSVSESSSRARLVPNSYSIDTYYSLVNKSKANIKDMEELPQEGEKYGEDEEEEDEEDEEGDEETKIDFVIKRHYTVEELSQVIEEELEDADMKAIQECFDIVSEDEDMFEEGNGSIKEQNESDADEDSKKVNGSYEMIINLDDGMSPDKNGNEDVKIDMTLDPLKLDSSIKSNDVHQGIDNEADMLIPSGLIAENVYDMKDGERVTVENIYDNMKDIERSTTENVYDNTKNGERSAAENIYDNMKDVKL